MQAVKIFFCKLFIVRHYLLIIKDLARARALPYMCAILASSYDKICHTLLKKGSGHALSAQFPAPRLITDTANTNTH